MSGAGQSPETAYSSGGETYRISVLHGREIEVVSPLLGEVFGRRGFTPEWIRRKYACERNGIRAFACVAFASDGQPAAVVGALPWPMRHGERTELAAQLADSATSSAHRGRGLHVQLVELVHEVSAAAGMTFVFRFSNDLSFAITTSKLGYTPIDALVEYDRPVRSVWAERLARRARLGAAYDRRFERVIEPYLDEATPLESSGLADGHAVVDRDEAFFAYKTAFGNSRILDLDGARVWLTARHGLLVGDMDADTDAELGRGLDALDRLGRRLGVHRILFQASPDMRLSRYLATRFPPTRTRHASCFDLGSKIPLEALRFTFGDIDTY